MKENGFTLGKEKNRRYPSQTITDKDYADDIAILANAHAQLESLLHSLKKEAGGIDLPVNGDKMEYMYFNQNQISDISTLTGGSLNLMDKFTHFEISVSYTENDINTQLAKAWTSIDRLLIIWKPNLSNEIKCNFFQVVVLSILLYGCTPWTLKKFNKKKLDSNWMVRSILNNSWRQHPTKQQLYKHLPPISKSNQIRRTRHARHR